MSILGIITVDLWHKYKVILEGIFVDSEKSSTKF